MGCGAAKSTIDVVPNNAKPFNEKPNGNALNAKSVLKPIPRKDGTNIDESESTKSDRPNSTSSHDSGYGDNEYKNIITEKSNPELIKKVEQEFKERSLDLAITGKGVTQLISNKEQQRIDQTEELKSLQMLKSNGLVQTSIVKKDNSLLFEIIDEKVAKANSESFPLPNNKLAPLKKVPPRFLKDKEKLLITPEQIAEKLEKANQRKLQQTQLKLNALGTHNEEEDEFEESITYNSKPFKAHPPSTTQTYDPEVYQRQKKLVEIRDRIRQNKIESATPTPRTPRTQELLNELDKFRSKTPSNFKAVFD